ncbi:hypothetical protein [Helicobacter turcicus]|uniref:hypothetical protein n=1 Tax=Helicobacter turcicus TaxID=2867412 RepID=UPI001F32FA81|nr:hypothetical protein [Helicobacter turcicus]
MGFLCRFALLNIQNKQPILPKQAKNIVRLKTKITRNMIESHKQNYKIQNLKNTNLCIELTLKVEAVEEPIKITNFVKVAG